MVPMRNLISIIENNKKKKKLILKICKAAGGSILRRFRKTAQLRRVSRFRFLIRAHLLASGPALQWPRRATHVRHDAILSFLCIYEKRGAKPPAGGAEMRSSKKPKPIDVSELSIFRNDVKCCPCFP